MALGTSFSHIHPHTERVTSVICSFSCILHIITILFDTSQRLKTMSSLSSVKLDDSVIQFSDTVKISTVNDCDQSMSIS